MLAKRIIPCLDVKAAMGKGGVLAAPGEKGRSWLTQGGRVKWRTGVMDDRAGLVKYRLRC